MSPDEAGADGEGFVVVGRAVVGEGRWVVGFALGDADVAASEVGTGDGVGEAALDDGTTSVGPPSLSEEEDEE